MSVDAQETKDALSAEIMESLKEEINKLSQMLDERIPEFPIQLQQILARLQELPETVWKLTDEQRAVIVAGFKQNMNVTIFQKASTGTSVRGHKIKGPISEDMF